MKRIFLPIFIFLPLSFFLFLMPKINPVFAASTVELTSTGDTFIDSWFPNYNPGTFYKLQVSRSTTTKQRILIKFNIDSVPTNATITSAVLHLYMMDCLGGAESNLLHIDRVTSSWSEKTANWDNSKNISASWGSGSAPCSSTLSYLKFDVTSLVKAWFNGTYSNWGFYIQGNEDSTGWGRAFYSRDHSSNNPKLVVVYTVPAQSSSPASGNQTTSPDTSNQTTTDTASDKDTTELDSANKSATDSAVAITKKATPSAEKTGISWARIVLLAFLVLLLIIIVAGYVVYRRRKGRSPKKDSLPSGKQT